MLNEEKKHAQQLCEKFQIGFLSSNFFTLQMNILLKRQKSNLIVQA